MEYDHGNVFGGSVHVDSCQLLNGLVADAGLTVVIASTASPVEVAEL
jgi:hypothetical protein